MSQTNQHFRFNSVMNEGSVPARTSYKTSRNILNKSICITPSSSGTIVDITTSTSVLNNMGPVVTYQAVSTPIQPYRILTETHSGQNYANPKQILNFSTLTYGNNSYPHPNMYITTGNRGANTSGHGCNTGESSQNTSSVTDRPEPASKPKNPRGSQKPKSIKVSRKKLTSLDVDTKKKLTASSSVSNYMKKDISDKEMEILEQMDDQSLKVVVSKVMDMTNRLCGDYMAEQLTKHLGQEKYDEIARGGLPAYTEFLSRRQSEQSNRETDDPEMVQSSSNNRVDLYRENDQLESAMSAIVDPEMVQGSSNKQNDQLESRRSAVANSGMVQKRNVIVESVQPHELIGCRRDASSCVAVKTEGGAGQGTQKNKPSQQTTPLTTDINYARVSGFLLTADTKAIAEEVLAQEEILAADMIITEKIDELKKMDTSGSSKNDSSFEDKWSFSYSKIGNKLPDKIFESPEEQQAKNSRRTSENQYFQLNSKEQNKNSQKQEPKQTEAMEKDEDNQSLLKCHDLFKEQKHDHRSQVKNLVQLDGTDKNGCTDRRSSEEFIHVTAENSLVTCESPIATPKKVKKDTKSKTDDPVHIKKIKMKSGGNLTCTKSYTVVNKLKLPKGRSKNEKNNKNQDCFQYDPLLSNPSQSISETICLTSSSSEMSAESINSSLNSPKVIAELLSPVMSLAREVTKQTGTLSKQANRVVQNLENTVGSSCNATSTPKMNKAKITKSQGKLKSLLMKSPKSKPKANQLPEVSVCSKNNSENIINTEKFTKLTKILSEAVLLQSVFSGDSENKPKVALATPEKEVNKNILTLKAESSSINSSSIHKENTVLTSKNTICMANVKTGSGKKENQDSNKSKRKVANKENVPVSPKIKKQETNVVPVKSVLKESNTFQSKYVEQVEKLKNIISAKEFWNTGQKYKINPVSVTVYDKYTKKVVEKNAKVSPNKEKQSSKNNADNYKQADTSSELVSRHKVAQSPDFVKTIPKEKVINVIDHQIIKPSRDNNFTKPKDQSQEKPIKEQPIESVTPVKLESNCVAPQIKQQVEGFVSKTPETKPSEPAGLNKNRSESPDIETSMNDLAELLMSLQESEPIFSSTSVSQDNKKDRNSLDLKLDKNIVEDESLNDAARTLIDIQQSSVKTAKIIPDINVKTGEVEVYSVVKSVVEVKAADDVDKDSPTVPEDTESTNVKSTDKLNDSQDASVGNPMFISVPDQTTVSTPLDVENKCEVDAVETLIDIQRSIVKTEAEISSDLNDKTEQVVVRTNDKLVVEVKRTDDECIVIEDDDESPDVSDSTNFLRKDELNVSQGFNKDASLGNFVCLPVTVKEEVLPSHDLQTKVSTESDGNYETCDRKITSVLEKFDNQEVDDDDDCVIVEASRPIVDTPLGLGNIRRYSDPFFCRRLLKLNRQRQRKLLRNRVKYLSEIILKRIKRVTRTYVQFRTLVRLTTFNVNDTSLDNSTLRSKVLNLNALYRHVNKTVVDLRRMMGSFERTRFTHGVRSWKGGFGEGKIKGRSEFGQDGKLRVERMGSKDEISFIGKYEEKVLPKPIKTYIKENKNTRNTSVSKICTTPSNKGKVSPNLCIFGDTEKSNLDQNKNDCDSRIDLLSLPGKISPKTSPEEQVFIKPTRTYLKAKSSAVSKSDPNICATPFNKANVFFNRSRSFIDDIRKSSLDRDDKADKTSPESIVHCIIYKDATPILNSISQKAKWKIVEMPAIEEVKNDPWPEVVVKEEPEESPVEKNLDSPKTGQKRKSSGTNKQAVKPALVINKEEPKVSSKEAGPVKNLSPTCAMSLRPRTRLSEIPKQIGTPQKHTPGKEKVVGDAKSPGKDTPSLVTLGKRRKTSDAKSLGKDFETPVRKLRERKKDSTPPKTNKKTVKTPSDRTKTVGSTPISKKRTGITPKRSRNTPVLRRRTPGVGQKYSLRERCAGNRAAE